MELIRYPFKLTTKVQVTETFKKHIISQHGCPEVFQAVEKVFENINQLREQLHFDKVDTNNLKKCEELETIIYKYLKYTRNLSKKFKFGNQQQGRVNIQFSWSDSFRKGVVITTNNLRVEMCSILYNLTILLYYIGYQYIQQNSSEGRQNAIKKFRNALWSLNELNVNLPPIIREFENLHLDFTVVNIITLENVLFGLTYGCLFHNLEHQEIELGFQNVAGLSGEANKHFQYAYKMITEMGNDASFQFSKAFLLEIRKYLYSNTVYYFSISALKMAKYHEKIFQTLQAGKSGEKISQIQAKKCPLGISIAYLLKAINILQIAFKNGDNLLPMMKQKIENSMKDIHTKYQDLIQKNQEVNHPIANFKDLEPTKSNANVTLTFPQDFREELPYEKQFLELLSDEVIQILKSAKNMAENNKQSAHRSLQDLKETRNLQYKKYSVNGFLEILYQSIYLKRKKEYSQLKEINKNQMMVEEEDILPHTIQQKIDEIKKIGGEAQIRNLFSVLEENFIPSSGLLEKSLIKLQEEKKEDDEYRNIYKEEWTVQPSSEANVEYIKQIADLQKRLREARKLDQESQNDFEKLRQYFDLIKQGSEYIMSKIPLSKDQKFTQSFCEKITELNLNDNEVVKLIQQAEREVPNITNCLQSIDLAKKIEECRKIDLNNKEGKKYDATKTIQYILSSSQQIAENILMNIAIAQSHIDTICNLATFLNKQKMESKAKDSINKIEEINNGFGKILELYYELQEGLEFYQALLDTSAELDSTISDFAVSRSFLRQNEVSRIKNKQRYGDAVQGANITDQPFFQDGSFPIGESHYIPPKNFESQSYVIEQG